jgi:hypothetical protein
VNLKVSERGRRTFIFCPAFQVFLLLRTYISASKNGICFLAGSFALLSRVPSRSGTATQWNMYFRRKEKNKFYSAFQNGILGIQQQTVVSLF